jgi:hypothetical protein
MHTVTVALLLTARFYTVADVPVSDRAAATQVAANILRAAGVEVAWKDCNNRRSSTDRAAASLCLTPPSPDEVIVRFVSAPGSTTLLNQAAGDRLGDAYVDKAAWAGTLATVYVDRVAAMARATGVDAGTLLGRVMAHEIGHLLLGTSKHRPSGLMRAEWSATLLQRRIGNDWRFSKVDAVGLREGLARRAEAVQKHASAEVVPGATVPCAAAASAPAGVTCPSCPVCATLLPADRMALHLLIEPGF